MKRYYYQITKVGRDRGGSRRSVYADVFVAKYSKITKIGQVKQYSAGGKGEKSEVYEFLYKKGLVGKREYSNNRGYYYRNKSKVEILSLQSCKIKYFIKFAEN